MAPQMSMRRLRLDCGCSRLISTSGRHRKMGTLSARNLRESLAKAKNVGIVEERFQLFDECEVVVRNLRPDEYSEIDAECKDLDGIDYLYKFQEGHVKRAVVE